MFFVLKKASLHALDIDVCLRLYDSMVLPILLFGCEIWGHENLQVLERVQLKFFKYLLKLKSSTASAFVYGELGRFP